MYFVDEIPTGKGIHTTAAYPRVNKTGMLIYCTYFDIFVDDDLAMIYYPFIYKSIVLPSLLCKCIIYYIRKLHHCYDL